MHADKSIIEHATDFIAHPETQLTIDPALRIEQYRRRQVQPLQNRRRADSVSKQQLTNLIWSHDCQVLAFDLTGVTFLSGGMLGLLVLLRDDVREIQLFNASTEVREVLSGENLNALFSLHEVDVSD